jgi:hypothetical protein
VFGHQKSSRSAKEVLRTTALLRIRPIILGFMVGIVFKFKQRLILHRPKGPEKVPGKPKICRKELVALAP